MDLVALIARAFLSGEFILGGVTKLMNPDGTMAMFAKYALPLPQPAYALTVTVELLGGLMLLLGIKTRWAAAVLGVWCIATALVAHSDFGDRQQQIQFFKNLAMCGGMLQVVAFGGGRFTVGRD